MISIPASSAFPLLAIPGVNVLSRLAEQMASTISFAAGEPSGRTPLRDGAHETTSSDHAGLPAKHHTIPCPLSFHLGQNPGQNPFCFLANNGGIIAILGGSKNTESWIRTPGPA
jgi:hypothetical protein